MNNIYKKSNNKSYTSFEIINQDKISESTKIALDFNDYTTNLVGALHVPSCSHAYDLGVQYIRDWFLNCMDRDKTYFKTVFINGSHVMADFKEYSRISLIYKEKPAVAITPMANLEFDRNVQDSYMGGSELLLRRYNHQQGFFRDFENNIFLGMNVREQQINFNIKCRVESRAEQFDLYRNMELRCRVGYTHKDFISCDFHIPMQLILNIAKSAKFKIKDIYSQTVDGQTIISNQVIEDIPAFLDYMNSKSDMPIVYKIRGASGQGEFFARAKRVYCHIDTTEKLSYDDGNRDGHIDNDFHVELNCVLNMWVPSFYAYKTAQDIYSFITLDNKAILGLWYCKPLEIPNTNKDGWNLYIKTEYLLSEEEKKKDSFEIDMTELFNKDILSIIKYCISRGISPSKFIDITVFNIISTAVCDIDWVTMKLNVINSRSIKLVFAIYIEMSFYNNKLIELNNLKETRL